MPRICNWRQSRPLEIVSQVAPAHHREATLIPVGHTAKPHAARRSKPAVTAKTVAECEPVRGCLNPLPRPARCRRLCEWSRFSPS